MEQHDETQVCGSLVPSGEMMGVPPFWGNGKAFQAGKSSHGKASCFLLGQVGCGMEKTAVQASHVRTGVCAYCVFDVRRMEKQNTRIRYLAPGLKPQGLDRPD